MIVMSYQLTRHVSIHIGIWSTGLNLILFMDAILNNCCQEFILVFVLLVLLLILFSLRKKVTIWMLYSKTSSSFTHCFMAHPCTPIPTFTPPLFPPTPTLESSAPILLLRFIIVMWHIPLQGLMWWYVGDLRILKIIPVEL